MWIVKMMGKVQLNLKPRIVFQQVVMELFEDRRHYKKATPLAALKAGLSFSSNWVSKIHPLPTNYLQRLQHDLPLADCVT